MTVHDSLKTVDPKRSRKSLTADYLPGTLWTYSESLVLPRQRSLFSPRRNDYRRFAGRTIHTKETRCALSERSGPILSARRKDGHRARRPCCLLRQASRQIRSAAGNLSVFCAPRTPIVHYRDAGVVTGEVVPEGSPAEGTWLRWGRLRQNARNSVHRT